jgi:hypothetical protein
MIRTATFGDMMRLRELFVEMHRRSKYAELSGLDEEAARTLLMNCIRANGRTNEGGTLFNVCERDGALEGFMIGTLNRIYHVGKRLQASDMTDRAFPHDLHRLVSAYLAWAEGNPRVAMIGLSETDAIRKDSARLAKLYERNGFRRFGTVWERLKMPTEMEKAA